MVIDIKTFTDKELLAEIGRRMMGFDEEPPVTPKPVVQKRKTDLDKFGEVITQSKTKPLGSVFEKKEEIGVADLVEACEREGYDWKLDNDIKRLSYHAATMRIEVGPGMNPSIREGFKKTDAEARAFVKRMGRSYAREVVVNSNTGQTEVFYGRGACQLTHGYNYRKISKEFGIDAYTNPDIVLEPVLSLRILIRGQNAGWFNGRGKGLQYYIDKGDMVEARRTINVTNRAQLVADWYEDFYKAFRMAVK